MLDSIESWSFQFEISYCSVQFQTEHYQNQMKNYNQTALIEQVYGICSNKCGVHVKHKHTPAIDRFSYKYQQCLTAQLVPARQTVNNITKLPVLTIPRGSSYTCCQIHLRVFNRINICILRALPLVVVRIIN